MFHSKRQLALNHTETYSVAQHGGHKIFITFIVFLLILRVRVTVLTDCRPQRLTRKAYCYIFPYVYYVNLNIRLRNILLKRIYHLLIHIHQTSTHDGHDFELFIIMPYCYLAFYIFHFVNDCYQTGLPSEKNIP